MISALIAVEMAAAGIIAWQAVRHCNQMSRCTDHKIRAVWVLVAMSSAAVMLGPLAGYEEDRWAHALMLGGIAILSVVERRRGTHRRQPQQHDRRSHA